MTKPTSLRMCAASLLAGLSLLLSGCFITPGKFTSELVLTDENEFTFTYEGEVFFLGLSQLAKMAAEEDAKFEAMCFDEDTGEDRECTQIEIDDQRANWEMGAEMRAIEAKREGEQMAAIMGDIDPTDPEAAEGLRQTLLRQNGWERVDIKGDGVFDVTYSVTGTLGHDFMFPIIEGMPPSNPFVQIIVRDEGVVRVNAPGFAAQNEDNPFGAMMGGMTGMAGLAVLNESKDDKADAMPDIPQLEGTFTIVTKGQMNIRANNTDEGPSPTPTGEALTWDITARTNAGPTALIAIGQ
ncbi:hypothetical protein [Erythrobacter crassostreae]|uniref:Lipoprotein n=1 Tax=Erythrobacter crassostreae TaxID=2828328 RepID=A0A9X1F528_9SPHN|nr:hypothetical protein [Erythrobacter crassostrea]MBV7259648.1 hypothetical protein [Erythrobacter crassostrea]